MMTERGIDLSFARRGIQDVVVADAFLFRELDWQQKQRRVDALIRGLFEIIPTEETPQETQLGKAVLGAVAFGFADDFVEHAGDVRSIFEAKILAEVHRRSLSDGGRKFGMPDEELLQFDIAIIKH